MPQDEPQAVVTEVEETADFGDEAAAPEASTRPAPAPAPTPAQSAPQRALPDYGDLVDGDDEPESKPKIAVKDEADPDAASAPKRPDAIYIKGCERLNRGHLAEIFEAKNLPEFVRVEWISDSEVIVVFSTDEDATTVFNSAIEGFRDVDDDGAPGPGLWRARRGMLDFRMATVADKADFGFKRLHRGGRQVRDFRMWTALTDMDKKILSQEDELNEQYKRPAPARDDLDDDGQPKSKRLKRGHDEGIDLLERMAHLDKKVLVKQEEKGELDPLPEIPPEEEEDDYGWPVNSNAGWDRGGWGRDQGNWGNGGGWQRGGRRNQQWGHDDRAGWGDEENARGGSKGGKKGGRGRRKGNDDWDDAKNSRGKDNNAVGALGDSVEATAEELKRRAKRNERFQKDSGSNKASAKQET